MITEAINTALIFCGPLLDLCLLAVLLGKGRWRNFPALLVLAFLDLSGTLVINVLYPSGNSLLFVGLYAATDCLSFATQCVLLFELAKSVLKPTGIWDREALKPLALFGGAGALVAFLATIFFEPTGIHGAAALQLRADLFAALFTTELVVAMMLSANTVGLPWRSHAMAIGQGLMVWSLVFASVEGLGAYLGPQNRYFQVIHYIRSVAYLVTVGYWTVSLWRDEPARKPISPALRKYVVALHEQVQYDLGKAGH